MTTGGVRWSLLVGSLMMGLVPVARAETDVAGTWQGHYTCFQGDTALTLSLRPQAGTHELRGLFHFYASASNPRVPEGCFDMTGRYDSETRKLTLSAGRWLLQPDNFVTVDLSGQLGPDDDHLSGQVLGPLCTRFELHRISSAPLPAATACRNGEVVAFAG